jgi:hypothetical protein
MLHRIAVHLFMQHANLVNAVHDAPHFGDGRPGQTLIKLQGLKPALDVEWFDVFGNLASPPGDEIVADDVLSDVSSVFRLRAYRVLAKVNLKVMLG